MRRNLLLGKLCKYLFMRFIILMVTWNRPLHKLNLSQQALPFSILTSRGSFSAYYPEYTQLYFDYLLLRLSFFLLTIVPLSTYFWIWECEKVREKRKKGRESRKDELLEIGFLLNISWNCFKDEASCKSKVNLSKIPSKLREEVKLWYSPNNYGTLLNNFLITTMYTAL